AAAERFATGLVGLDLAALEPAAADFDGVQSGRWRRRWRCRGRHRGRGREAVACAFALAAAALLGVRVEEQVARAPAPQLVQLADLPAAQAAEKALVAGIEA